MPTLNPRINVTVTPEIVNVLNMRAKQKNTSLSKVTAELIAQAVEDHEDMYFSKIANEIEASNPEWIDNHPSIWE